MKATVFVAVLAGAAVSLGGCGTVCNLVWGVCHPESEPRVYGGVMKDCETMDKLFPNGAAGKGAVFICGVGMADLASSFVGDTLTLPITLPLQNRRFEKDGGLGAITVSSASPGSESVPRTEQLPTVQPPAGNESDSAATAPESPPPPTSLRDNP